MFKAARWRSEKNKIKVVFKLQFHATQVPLSGSETVLVSLVPLDVGKPTVRSEKIAVMDGTCNWLNPIYETVKLARDPKTGKINEKFYQFLVSATGSNKPALLGEVTVNLADYVEVFKASTLSLLLKAGAILHVTIQRIQDDVADREAEGNGNETVRQQRRTLQNQLSKYDNEKGLKALIGRTERNLMKDGSHINREPRVKFSSSRNLPTCADKDGKLQKRHSSDAISAANSGSSSEINTPRENIINSGSNQKNSSSFTSIDARPKLTIISGDWSETSAPSGNTDESKNSSGDSGLRARLQCSDDTLEKQRSDVFLTRKVETSELELQNLRKQIVKESRRGQDLSKELSSLKEERDSLRRECEELKISQKRTNFDENVSSGSRLAREDPLSTLEEIKQELDHEKNLNSSLRLQLQKTQEANSELLLAVSDLDDLLEQKDRETPCHKCRKIAVKADNDEDIRCMEFGDGVLHLRQSESKQELLETTLEDNKEQHEVGAKKHDHMSVTHLLEKKIIDLNSELELYKKDREDLEMQMEQLALDYVILKQENHDISSKLEQTQLHEQLRIQYECSAHIAIINDLEGHVECLEKELQTQAESFESDVGTIVQDKVEQEKKVIEAEEALRKTKWNNANTIERLQEELQRLSSQVSIAFYVNEKIVKQVLKEASELRSQKSHLEKVLEKTKQNLASAQVQYRINLQQLFGLLNFKSKETDKLLLELKDKNEELESRRKSEEARLKANSEKMQFLTTEIEKLKLVSEEREKLVTEMENLETTNKANEMMLQDKNLESELLNKEIVLLKQEVEKSLERMNDLRNMRDEKETMITSLNSEVEALRLQYNDLKQSLSEGEIEKEKLRLVSNLAGGLLKEEDMITSPEEQLGNSYKNGEIRLIHSSSQSLKNWRNEVKDMESTEVKHQGDVDCLQPRMKVKAQMMNFINSKDQKLVTRCSRTNSEDKQSCACDQHKVAEVLSEMALLRRKNESTETDLKEMQERYSEISLKFAEVEGERQQLMMTIRTLKNALKH